jgi:hypothetical protein
LGENYLAQFSSGKTSVSLYHNDPFSKKLADVNNKTTNLAFVEPEQLKETDPLTFAQNKKQKAW